MPEAVKVADMPRLLFVVARDEPGLLDFLRRDFAAEEAAGEVEIFMDRRQDRWRHDVQPREAEERDWNRNSAVSISLRELGCAFVPQQPVLPQG